VLRGLFTGSIDEYWTISEIALNETWNKNSFLMLGHIIGNIIGHIIGSRLFKRLTAPRRI